jgi:hypothetical protein
VTNPRRDAAGRSIGDEDDQLESDILALLSSPGSPGLFSVSEICLDIGDTIAATDALDRLHRLGVIHRCGEFVLMTRSAARTLQLAER